MEYGCSCEVTEKGKDSVYQTLIRFAFKRTQNAAVTKRTIVSFVISSPILVLYYVTINPFLHSVPNMGHQFDSRY